MDKLVDEAQQWLDQWKSNINDLKITKVVDNTIYLIMQNTHELYIQVQEDGSFVVDLVDTYQKLSNGTLVNDDEFKIV
jgi:hypothetical protein